VTAIHLPKMAADLESLKEAICKISADSATVRPTSHQESKNNCPNTSTRNSGDPSHKAKILDVNRQSTNNTMDKIINPATLSSSKQKLSNSSSSIHKKTSSSRKVNVNQKTTDKEESRVNITAKTCSL
jgi:hypothetical protein